MKHLENFKLEKNFSKILIKLQNIRVNELYKFSKVKKLVSKINPTYKTVYKYKKCKRKLKYIGDTNKYFTNGKIYKSFKFNGATYKIKTKKIKKVIGYSFFERLS
jgi:3'-phosphoadenosine 5'-phosphosulfate sulfotransferase